MIWVLDLVSSLPGKGTAWRCGGNPEPVCCDAGVTRCNFDTALKRAAFAMDRRLCLPVMRDRGGLAQSSQRLDKEAFAHDR